MAKKVKQSWLVRCMTAKTTGQFTQEDRRDAYFWNSCAVGEQRKMFGAKVIPYRHINYSGMMPTSVKINKHTPTDCVLNELGGLFNRAVANNQPVVAMQLLEQIEDRALELKRSK